MRVFIGIEITKAIKHQLADIQEIVKFNSKKGNFSYPENFHATLKFLGEVDKSQVDCIKETMDKGIKKHHPFDLTTGEIGFFPRGNKKIIWVSLKGNLHNLYKLFEDLETSLQKIGFPKEKNGLKPHITLGREVLLDQEFEEIQKTISISSKITINTISLFHSTRLNGKLTYIPIHRILLK